MRCIRNGKVFLPCPPALQDSHRGMGGGDIGSGRDWVVVGCTRVFWKGGFGVVGLWGFGLAGGPLLWGCVWACVGMSGHVCHACNAPRVGLRCGQGGPGVGLPQRPCQHGAGLYGACMGPVWGLCKACMALCWGGSSVLPPIAVAALEVQLRANWAVWRAQ